MFSKPFYCPLSYHMLKIKHGTVTDINKSFQETYFNWFEPTDFTQMVCACKHRSMLLIILKLNNSPVTELPTLCSLPTIID